MPKPLTPDLAELKRLYEASTPGIWVSWFAHWGKSGVMTGNHPKASGTTSYPEFRRHYPDGRFFHVIPNGNGDGVEISDADFIAAAHNAFPALLALAEEAVAVRARVAVVERETLERAAKVCDEHADIFTVKRVVPRDMERNYYGGALMASEHIAKEIRSLITPVTP